MDMPSFSKILILIGLGLVVVGVVVFLLGKSGLPLGNFPGDLKYERPGFAFSFPIVTSIIISVALTILLNVALWFMRK